MTPTQDSWHLSKSVPVTLIFGLITQGAAIVWTVSMMLGDIDRNAANIKEMELRVNKIEEMVYDQAVSMARIDENIKAIRSAVEKMATRGQ